MTKHDEIAVGYNGAFGVIRMIKVSGVGGCSWAVAAQLGSTLTVSPEAHTTAAPIGYVAQQEIKQKKKKKKEKRGRGRGGRRRRRRRIRRGRRRRRRKEEEKAEEEE